MNGERRKDDRIIRSDVHKCHLIIRFRREIRKETESKDNRQESVKGVYYIIHVYIYIYIYTYDYGQIKCNLRNSVLARA